MRPMTAPSQMPLPLEYRAAHGRDDFLVSQCNAEAVAALEDWRAWPGGRMALVGPARAGKTHLAEVWRAQTGAALVAAAELAGAETELLAEGSLVVEDVESAAGEAAVERALFHLHNLMAARGHALLLTGREAPARWPVRLPDLASRLAALPVARIAPPDDALLSAVLVKLAADRGLALRPAVVTYLVRRMERSFAAADRLIAALDRASLAARRPVSERLAAEILAREGRD